VNRGDERVPPPDGIDVVVVGAGEVAVVSSPLSLMAPALGSCVALTLWDPKRHLGGMAHIMLPAPTDAASRGTGLRFASFAVPELVSRLKPRFGRVRLEAKISGGAAMFAAESPLVKVGERNVAEVRNQLGLLNIPLVAEDTGGDYARTMVLHAETGLVIVRSYRYGIVEL